MNEKEAKILLISIRQAAFILLMVLIGSLIFWQLKNFIPAFLGAYTLFILLRQWMTALTKRLKGKAALAAAILMIGSFVIILLPINGFFSILSSRILPAVKHSNELWSSVVFQIHNLEDRFGFIILSEQNIQNLSDWGKYEMQKVVGATFNGLISVIVMYFILFFMLTEAETLEKTFYKWLPLKDKNVSYLKKQLNNLVVSNAIGIPLVALFQSLVALVGFWLAGVQEPFLWFLAMCVAAVVPILGSALVYIPLGFMLIAQGLTTQGVFLLLYGFFVIGSVDNIFRFWLQEKIGHVHPLITVFGVIIGLNLFGFIGLIFGPILISLFLLLVEIYRKEFIEKPTDDDIET
jgi:predicted PurR-regulated permease PerM